MIDENNIKNKLFIRYKKDFANPSFLTGLARVLDLGSTMNRDVKNAEDTENADFQALLGDWYDVGDSIRYAITSYEENKTHSK